MTDTPIGFSGFYNQNANIFEQSGQNLQNAGTGLNYAALPFSGMQSLNMFLNPYVDSVISGAVSRNRDSRNEALNMVGADAAIANAFGGSRQGLVESEVIDNYARNEDELVSRLLQQGFNTAGTLGQQDLARRQSAATGLGDLGRSQYALGQSAALMQQQAGMQQRSMEQSVLDRVNAAVQGFSNYPSQNLATILSALQGNPMQSAVSQTGTQQYNPGLFGYLGAVASPAANVWSAGKG